MDCVFCKIVSGEIPSAALYEDENWKVILDRFPASYGHTIIVYKHHAETIFELPESAAASLFPLVQRVASAIMRSISPEGINILQNNGKAAGQTIPHFHIHLIPRTSGDSISIDWKPSDINLGDLEKLKLRLLTEFAGTPNE